MIDVQDLEVERGGRTILDRYSLALDAGAVLGILGANGVGKTTLLTAMIGNLPLRTGDINIRGRVGFVPQLASVPFSYSALDIALMGRAKHLGMFGNPGKRDFEIVKNAFDILDIAGLAHQQFNTLSGGQMQLVMIAQALASECTVLILDEPCAALDYRNQEKVLALLTELQVKEGMTIVFSSHMPQHVVEIATHVLLMASSHEFKFGRVDEILNAPNLTNLYGLPVGRANFELVQRHTYAPLFGGGQSA